MPNAINAASGTTGVTAKANAQTIKATTTTVIGASATAALVINGVSMSIALDQNDTAQDTRNNVAKEINKYTGLSGVTASDNGSGGLSLTAADGRNVSAWFGNASATAANFGLGGATIAGTNTAYTVLGVADTTNIATDNVQTAYASVRFESAKTIGAAAGSLAFGSTSNFGNLGF